ncbi:MAG: sulfatase, partial [Candidatus Aminicenantes bacterium]|nr:sulfatase [Candidatus Aminicenantes bacterium]
MARKKIAWISAGMAAAAVLSLLLFYPRQTNDTQIPSLLSRQIRFDTALIERAWNEVASQADLKRCIFRDRVNRFFTFQAVNCRVKYKKISYQALLAPAGSRLEFELNAKKDSQLTFSLFNPQPEALKFIAKAAVSGKETILLSRSIQGQMSKVEKILLPKTDGKTVRLILETQGRGVGAWVNPCQLQNRPRPRTVLILMLDTLRADHVSAYGYRRLTTPALDELAKGSLMFSRAFSTSSWTLPAHVSLFSGRDVLAHGVVAPKSLIPSALPLLAEKMQQKGFVTLAMTGGGFVDDQYGFYRGFQKYVNRISDIFRRSAAELLYRAFQSKVDDFSDQDLFIFLHTFQIHAPYKAPDSYYRAFNPKLDIKIKYIGGHLRLLRKSSAELPTAESADRQKLIDLYDASILYSDQELLKPLLAYLSSSNRFNDAMVIVLSDHGEEFYDHGDWEHGHTLYQELTRIPLIIKLPQQKRGEIREKLFS